MNMQKGRGKARETQQSRRHDLFTQNARMACHRKEFLHLLPQKMRIFSRKHRNKDDVVRIIQREYEGGFFLLLERNGFVSFQVNSELLQHSYDVWAKSSEWMNSIALACLGQKVEGKQFRSWEKVHAVGHPSGSLQQHVRAGWNSSRLYFLLARLDLSHSGSKSSFPLLPFRLVRKTEML